MGMAKILDDLSRTFSEYLLIPRLTRKTHVPRNVSLAAPLARHRKDEPSRLMAMFLSGKPQGDLESLAPGCVMGEEVRLGPGCLYIWFPQGAGVSKLANSFIERRLKVRGTARNWNTVLKLGELAQ